MNSGSRAKVSIYLFRAFVEFFAYADVNKKTLLADCIQLYTRGYGESNAVSVVSKFVSFLLLFLTRVDCLVGCHKDENDLLIW